MSRARADLDVENECYNILLNWLYVFLTYPMSYLSRRDLVGELTKDELIAILPANTFTKKRRSMTWSYIVEVLWAQSNDVLSIVQHAKAKKNTEMTVNQIRRAETKRQAAVARRQNEAGLTMDKNEGDDENTSQEGELSCERVNIGGSGPLHNLSKYLDLPSDTEVKNCFRAFREATSNAALAMEICIVCVRELGRSEGKEHKLHDN